ncbi:hypothetical protein [Verrucomicrobium spinosum]|uniref:hypothetical protein n=1 Tax=Verrucomicrobium spinosum TaxID=2736 RepID=UPI001E49E9B1|nr:hypothetical protein [Verrucomicrobium spinosum]
MRIEIKPLTPSPSVLGTTPALTPAGHSVVAACSPESERHETLPVCDSLSGGDKVAAPPIAPAGSRGVIGKYWRKVGGGSLGLSLLIHLAILVGAYFMVQTVVQKETPVDFLPGGGSKAGQAASASLNAQLKQKKQSNLTKSPPLKRVVSSASSTAIALPDLPMDSLDMPEMSSPTSGGLSGGAFGSGGFGGSGSGGGFGNGVGMGGGKGFAPMTVFGRAGDSGGLAGAFYDLKQNPEREPTGYTKGAFIEAVHKVSAAKFSDDSMRGYYKAKQQINFTYLLVPADMQASEGPKCFNVEKEVEPSGWFVHYGGTVVPPRPGMWRFVGFFDDLLIVYINNKPVLDGSWVPMAEGYDKDKDMRQDFKGPAISGGRTAYCGKWVSLNEPFRLDILVGERPGGKVGGLLLVQQQNEKYEVREDGTPILPVFTTTKLEMSDTRRLYNDEFAKRVQLARNPPVFEVRQSGLSGGRSRGIGLLPPSSR